MTGLRPRDLHGLTWATQPQVAPDGNAAVWVRTRIDAHEDTYERSLQLWDGTRVRPFTAGPKDGTPRWSPAGGRVAFLRTSGEEDAVPQVHLIDVDGGEARVLTDLPLGVEDLAWTPDGRRLVVVAAFPHAAVADLSPKERERRAKRITSLPYRFDNEGWRHDRTTHLVVVDADADTPTSGTRLTSGEVADHGQPTVSPDGARVAWVAIHGDGREFHPADQVWTMPIDGGEPTLVLDSGEWWGLAWDDHGLHAVGFTDTFDWPGSVPLWRLGDGHGPATPVRVDAGDRTVGGGSLGCSPALLPVDGGLLTAREDRGRQSLVLIRDDGTVDTVLDGEFGVSGVGATADRSTVVVALASPSTPGDIVLLRDGETTVLADHGAAVADRLRPMERFTVDHDGVELDCWAVLPEGDGPWPVVLNIHGGPTAQYGDYLFDEFQVEAAAGYLVVGGNPRGSSGRSTEWARDVVGVWGETDSLDMRDCLAMLDAALDRYDDKVDRERLGIMGGSYGGYATARILTFDDRFRTAIVERGLLQWESFTGTSDIGTFFDRMFLGTSAAEDLDLLRRASPVLQADRISTPTLVLHSEHDYRCPIEQAEQLFVTLRRNGTPTEFVRFPDEGHELSRSGSPKHRIERFDVVLEWLGRWLDNPWTTDSLAEFTDDTARSTSS